MQAQITVIIALVTVTQGKSDTYLNKLSSLSSTQSGVVQQMLPIKITHDLLTEVARTGNDVLLKGITSHNILIPGIQHTITWSKDNSVITYSTERIYFENQKLHLRLNDVRPTDAGKYEFRIMYVKIQNNKPSIVWEVTNILLIVNDDGDLCSDTEMLCKGYCIPKHQRCTGGDASLGLIIGSVIGSVIILLACVLLFLLSRRGREFCRSRQDDSVVEIDDGGLNIGSSSTSKRRNGAVVSFAASPTVQIYEREDEYVPDSSSSPVDDKDGVDESCEQNGTISCKTTTV